MNNVIQYYPEDILKLFESREAYVIVEDLGFMFKEFEYKFLTKEDDVDIYYDSKNLKINIRTGEIPFKLELTHYPIWLNNKVSKNNLWLELYDDSDYKMASHGIEPQQDMLYIARRLNNKYENIILMLLPKSKEYINSTFKIENIGNYRLVLFLEKEKNNG